MGPQMNIQISLLREDLKAAFEGTPQKRDVEVFGPSVLFESVFSCK